MFSINNWDFSSGSICMRARFRIFFKLGDLYYLQKKMATPAKSAWWGLFWCPIDFANIYILGVYHCSSNIMNGINKGAYGNMVRIDSSGSHIGLGNAYSSSYHKEGNYFFALSSALVNMIWLHLDESLQHPDNKCLQMDQKIAWFWWIKHTETANFVW